MIGLAGRSQLNLDTPGTGKGTTYEHKKKKATRTTQTQIKQSPIYTSIHNATKTQWPASLNMPVTSREETGGLLHLKHNTKH